MRPSNLSRLVLSLSIAAALGLPAAGCTKSPAPAAAATDAKPAAVVEKVVDEHSYAEPDKVRTTDLALDLAVNFDNKTLSGTASPTQAAISTRAKLPESQALRYQPAKMESTDWATFTIRG